METREAKQSAKAGALVNPLRELANAYRRLKQRLVVVIVEMDGYKAREEEHEQAVTDSKIEVANIKEAMRALEDRVSSDASLMHAAVNERNSLRNQLVAESSGRKAAEEQQTTQSSRLKTAEQGLSLDVWRLGTYANKVGKAEAVQKQMKSNLQKYIQTMLDQLNGSKKA